MDFSLPGSSVHGIFQASVLEWGAIVFKHIQNKIMASLVAQLVKNRLAMWETWVQPLGWEDPLEEGMKTHSNILAWENLTDREAWQATVHEFHGVTKSWTRLND